jgi:hypothetical protein
MAVAGYEGREYSCTAERTDGVDDDSKLLSQARGR